MTPLRLGPLSADGFRIVRSGIRWLQPDGGLCRAREPVAFCNLHLPASTRGGPRAFPTEWRDLQVAFAPTVGGRLRHGSESGRGGDIDRLPTTAAWDPDFVIGHIESEDGRPAELELLMLTGRRISEFVEVRSQIHAGWHGRSRGWWSGSGAPPPTLIGAGVCEQTGILRGERGAYMEAFEDHPAALQIVTTQDEPLVPRARILLEGLRRTPEEAERIGQDVLRGLADAGAAIGPADWVFFGALLSGLKASPLSEGFEVLTRAGLGELGPARHVLLSLHAEGERMFRHNRLGYHIDIYQFRFRDLGPAVQAWMRANFDLVPISLEDIARDYANLLGELGDRQVMVMNKVAARWHEDVWCYAGLPAPLGDRVATVRTREQNLMLDDVVAAHGACVVDVDAIASDLGIAHHIFDGVHQSGALQSEVRLEIFRLVAAGG